MAGRADPIKDFVAGWIASKLTEMQADAPADVESIEIHPVSPRETVIRVRTSAGMPRYLSLKLSEPI